MKGNNMKKIFASAVVLFMVTVTMGAVSCCSAPAKGGIEISGKIAVVGNEPFTHLILRTEKGEFILTGEKKAQLWTMQNAVVTVCGTLSPDKATLPNAAGTITVTDFKK